MPSVKGIVWILLLQVFLIRGYELYIHAISANTAAYDMEDADHDAPFSDPDEDIFKKDAKESFSFFEDGLRPCLLVWNIDRSQHWSIYSVVIFTVPLRDVLTPPPNCISA